MKLKNHPYAQCSVRVQIGGTLVFTSYNTDVIYINKDGWLYVSGLYSATTRKQIGWFLNEYAPAFTYQFVKMLYNKRLTCNIHTGEVKNA